MAASRIASSRRLCFKYKYFFYVASVIFGLQLFLGYSFYNLTQKEIKIMGQPSDDVQIQVDRLPQNDRIKSVTNGSESEQQDQENGVESPSDESHVAPAEVLGNMSKNDFNLKSYQKCQIDTKEALSAISRASTLNCKKQLADVACDLAEEKLFPSSLPNFCPLNKNNTGEFMGCYKDTVSSRDLLGPHKEFPDHNSPKTCINYCFMLGYQYAGVQFTKECWCGERYGSHGEADILQCNSPCPGNPAKKCGGFLSQAVYSTGLSTKLKHSAELVKEMVMINNNLPVKIVFVLTLNGRQVRQVRRLLRVIYNSHHYYYIHVDARQEYLYRELLPLQDNFSNVKLSHVRFATIWGGASLLDAHLHFMSELLSITDWAWDYYVNLSESDYPIKRIESLAAFLTKYRGYNFLKSHGRDTQNFIKKQGLDKTFFECDHHLWRIGSRTLPQGIRMDGGSDWIGLYREFVNFTIKESNPLLTGLKKMYKYALLPAESFFHVLLQNSQFCNSWVDNNLHLTNWRRKQGCKCQYKHIVDWCGCSPNDFKTSDMDKIMNYENKATFFGRKFEAIVNQDIINQMDAYMYGNSVINVPGINSYWENLYHHQDGQKPADQFMTVYQSFIRMSLRHLAQKAKTCNLKVVNLLEVTVHYLSDSFHGALILHQVELVPSGEKFTLETRLDKSDYYQVFKPEGPMERLLHMEVGTDYDPKEEIFRNYLLIMGPLSPIALRHAWSQGVEFTVSIAWIDPANVIAASYDILIPKTTNTAIHKPTFLKPLRPGVWTVKMMHNWKVIAETQFLIVPQTILNGKPITPAEVDLLHNGPKGHYDSKDFEELKEVLNVNVSTEAMEIAKLNARKVGKPLQSLVDSLVEKFWGIQSICSLQGLPKNCPKLQLCPSTLWSSHSPDPKSNLEKSSR